MSASRLFGCDSTSGSGAIAWANTRGGFNRRRRCWGCIRVMISAGFSVAVPFSIAVAFCLRLCFCLWLCLGFFAFCFAHHWLRFIFACGCVVRVSSMRIFSRRSLLRRLFDFFGVLCRVFCSVFCSIFCSVFCCTLCRLLRSGCMRIFWRSGMRVLRRRSLFRRLLRRCSVCILRGWCGVARCRLRASEQ